MASKVFESFSLTHAQVLDGSTSFDTAMASIAAPGSDWDVYGVNDGKFTPKTQQWENTGDDVIGSVWNWVDNADVAIQAGYMNFGLISQITGVTISSSGVGAAQWLRMSMWRDDTFNVSPRPVLLRSASKDDAGVVRVTDILVYRLQFAPITWDGPTYKAGLKVNYAGQAVMSSKDELGQPFADGKRRCVDFVNHP